MHLGRQYRYTQFIGWTRWEAGYLIFWSLSATLFLQVSQWNFLTVPAPILTIIGSALAIIIAFKNQQCYARFDDALRLSGRLITNSLILANKLTSVAGNHDAAPSEEQVKEIFYRHFAWLTALRFSLRERKFWENALESGNVRFLANLPTPESKSALKEELKAYLSEAELDKFTTHRGDKEALILHWQYRAITDLYNNKTFGELMFTMLAAALDDLARLQGALKRIKNYPYARNFYSIAVMLVKMFAAIVPFALFPYAQDLGKPAGIGHWTAWLNVPFSVVVGWVFVSLEKVGENSSNPFEGRSNDVPISFIARRIEIDMRIMLGEETDLKPIEAKDSILF
jgi:ion channel-forming bestrophin family protein